MKNLNSFDFLRQPLAYGSFSNLLKLLWSNGGFDLRYTPKALYVIMSSLIGTPTRLLEKIIYDAKVENTSIEHPPIFIIGHWRSGTTYIHRLMTQDPNFGFVWSLQSFSPETFLSVTSMKSLTPLLESIFPPKRAMDNVSYSFNVPEEEEYALGNLTPLSFYHGWFFPKHLSEHFSRAVLFEGVSDRLKAKWKQSYVKILKKTTLHSGGKRLIIKNPANTSRITELLELFPDAKFIHIYRNPYTLYSSVKVFFRKLMPIYKLQDISEDTLERHMLDFYDKLMSAYVEQRKSIPNQNLIEIRYEDFIGNEMSYLEKIYRQFDLNKFD
ncbi:MAG: sulfotransferase, partial [Cyanobacteria bacterium P01_D01_bin.123]